MILSTHMAGNWMLSVSISGSSVRAEGLEVRSLFYSPVLWAFSEASSRPPHRKVSGLTEQVSQEDKVEGQGSFIT